MQFDILTIFPEMFDSPFQASLIGKARERGVIEVRIVNIRDFAEGKHRMTDDYPFGGGEGMVMKPEPIVRAIESVRGGSPDARVALLTPQGKVLDHRRAVEMASRPHWVLVCGRYEGVDERVREHFVDEEISIGDYILTGGEMAAMVMVDAISRFVPGMVGKAESVEEDSFAHGLLEYPQYTRPREFRGHMVPEVLLSGDHRRIAEWKRRQALKRTAERRPDLLRRDDLPEEDRVFIERMKAEGTWEENESQQSRVKSRE